MKTIRELAEPAPTMKFVVAVGQEPLPTQEII